MMYRARREAFIAGCIAAAGLVLLLPGGVAAQDAVQARLLTEAHNASGEGLFKQFPPGNVVFSPIVDDATGAILFQGRIVDPQ